jgi:hypothetical protein
MPSAPPPTPDERAKLAADHAERARKEAEGAAEAAKSARNSLVRVLVQVLLPTFSLIVLAALAIGALVAFAVFGPRGVGREIVLIVAVALSIGLVVVGVAGTRVNPASGPNYLEREMNEARARRTSLMGLALVVVGAALMVAALVVVSGAGNGREPTGSSSTPPSPSATSHSS